MSLVESNRISEPIYLEIRFHSRLIVNAYKSRTNFRVRPKLDRQVTICSYVFINKIFQ